MSILRMNNYISDDSGSVTVDWVVLTATAIVVSFAVLTVIANGLGAGANDIDSELERVAAFSTSGDTGIPEGFTNSGFTDDATGEPIYVNSDTNEVSVGGVVSDAGDYTTNNPHTCTSVCAPPT